MTHYFLGLNLLISYSPPVCFQVNVEIIDINNRAPVFNAAGQTIKLSQAMPVGIDFGSLINEGRLSVYDGDFDTQTNGAIVLTVNNLNFQILPPIVGTAANVPYKDPKIYYPRVALAQPLTGNTSFQLIAQVSHRYLIQVSKTPK